MKRTAYFLKAFVALTLMLQGASLSASCAVECRMSAAQKLRCVMGSLLEHAQALAHERAGVIEAQGACGHLEFRAQAPAVVVAKVGLSGFPSAKLFSLAAPISLASAVLPDFNPDTRAGPIGPKPAQALLAVPPQNAPPVLV
jgi:hypothetical protein